MDIITFTKDNWSYFTTVIFGLFIFLSKILEIREVSKKENLFYQKSYTFLLRLYFNYLNSKIYFYSLLPKIAKKIKAIDQYGDILNNFPNEIRNFKKEIQKIEEHLPNLANEIYSLILILDRFLIMEKLFALEEISIQDKPNLPFTKEYIKKALFYAFSDLLDESFDDLLRKIGKKAKVSKTNLNFVCSLNKGNIIEKTELATQEVLSRYVQSLRIDNLISKEDLDKFIKEFKIDEFFKDENQLI
ncbi:hypothetical protein LEP1GSC195_1390 [Leptospira wolbachii serovar Codice str. CDC]|uniref:Uncharacterized protein n=1 Tax=Leptospira wolbachii serovar Codice str. CDC TaxID=1218599 RepID=R8ZXW1_9LEPT|nr:hypothetical protein [Leptospira wolbachii]EOQ94796.1 hypothetical protein LEP1GSC195_1390 [Leptospira wolbachii serovar Codice str. CDC]